MKDRHMDFALEYLSNGYNATQAYLTVYKGTPKTARINANRILNREDVQEFIQEQRKAHYDSKMIDLIRWAEEVSDIAFAEKGDITYTTADKLKALQMLQRFLGLDTQKIETKQEVIEVNIED